MIEDIAAHFIACVKMGSLIPATGCAPNFDEDCHAPYKTA
jgi:hypothetical protein